MKITDFTPESLLPHASPMVLIDEIVSGDKNSVQCRVTIKNESLFCKDNAVGAWVGMEYMAQAIGVHAGFLAKQKNCAITLGFILGTRHYQCSTEKFEVGSTLDILANQLYISEEGLGAYQCTIQLGNKELANAVCTVFQPPKEKIKSE